MPRADRRAGTPVRAGGPAGGERGEGLSASATNSDPSGRADRRAGTVVRGRVDLAGRSAGFRQGGGVFSAWRLVARRPFRFAGLRWQVFAKWERAGAKAASVEGASRSEAGARGGGIGGAVNGYSPGGISPLVVKG